MEKSETRRISLRDELISLHRRREMLKRQRGHTRRQRLSTEVRRAILEKTGGRCHICGGVIRGDWNADHVLAHSIGGASAPDNYLPAHGICNNYRWYYLPEEFQLILKLGVWARTQIEKGTKLGRAIEEKFTRYESKRTARRKHRGW